jgi:hypothetical protein
VTLVAAGGERDLPDVELVVEQHRGVVLVKLAMP